MNEKHRFFVRNTPILYGNGCTLHVIQKRIWLGFFYTLNQLNHEYCRFTRPLYKRRAIRVGL